MQNKQLEQEIDEFIIFAKECDNEISKEINGAPTKKKLQGYLVICNYIRFSELFHAVVALAEQRLPSGAFVVLRTMTENYVHLHGCIEDPVFSQEYIKKHLESKLKRIKNLAKDLSSVGFQLSEVERLELESYQASLVEEQEGKTLSNVYQVFKRFKKESLYHQVFAHCSLWVHNDSYTFMRYLNETPSGLEFREYEEKNIDTVLCLLMALKLHFFAYEEMARFVGREPKCREKFAREYNEFHDKFASLRSPDEETNR